MNFGKICSDFVVVQMKRVLLASADTVVAAAGGTVADSC